MSFLEIFTLFASGVTIFGLIVAGFSVYNGRMTRREVAALICETQQLTRDTQAETRQLIREVHEAILAGMRESRELIARESQETRELIARGEAATRQLIQENQVATREVLLRIIEILARIDERVR